MIRGPTVQALARAPWLIQMAFGSCPGTMLIEAVHTVKSTILKGVRILQVFKAKIDNPENSRLINTRNGRATPEVGGFKSKLSAAYALKWIVSQSSFLDMDWYRQTLPSQWKICDDPARIFERQLDSQRYPIFESLHQGWARICVIRPSAKH